MNIIFISIWASQNIIYHYFVTRDLHTSNFHYIKWFEHNLHHGFAFWNGPSIGLIEFMDHAWDIWVLRFGEYLEVIELKRVPNLHIPINNSVCS